MENKREMRGALVGWKWTESRQGEVLTIQLAQSVNEFNNNEFDRVHVALNERQLRSLARDVARMAQSHRLQLWGRPSWWRRLLSRTHHS